MLHVGGERDKRGTIIGGTDVGDGRLRQRKEIGAPDLVWPRRLHDEAGFVTMLGDEAALGEKFIDRLLANLCADDRMPMFGSCRTAARTRARRGAVACGSRTYPAPARIQAGGSRCP